MPHIAILTVATLIGTVLSFVVSWLLIGLVPSLAQAWWILATAGILCGLCATVARLVGTISSSKEILQAANAGQTEYKAAGAAGDNPVRKQIVLQGQPVYRPRHYVYLLLTCLPWIGPLFSLYVTIPRSANPDNSVYVLDYCCSSSDIDVDAVPHFEMLHSYTPGVHAPASGPMVPV